MDYMSRHDAEEDFRRMLVLDALVLNTDRHAGNYGMLFDTDTMQVSGMAPVFDHNQALLPYAEPAEFDNLQEYLSTRPTRIGEDFNEDVYKRQVMVSCILSRRSLSGSRISFLK